MTIILKRPNQNRREREVALISEIKLSMLGRNKGFQGEGVWKNM